MGTWRAVGQYVTPQAISDTSSLKKLQLGTTIRCKYQLSASTDTDLGEAEFIYLLGVASTAAYDAVTFTYAFQSARAVADATGPVGIAQSANLAAYYGWYQRRGIAQCNVASGFAANKPVYLTSTAGTLDDAVVAGDKVENAISLSAINTPVTGDAYVWLDLPLVDDQAET